MRSQYSLAANILPDRTAKIDPRFWCFNNPTARLLLSLADPNWYHHFCIWEIHTVYAHRKCPCCHWHGLFDNYYSTHSAGAVDRIPNPMRRRSGSRAGRCPQLAAQTVFEGPDVEIALTIVTTLMNFGGGAFISVGSSIFNNRAVAVLQSDAPAVSAALATGMGLTDLVDSLPASEQSTVIDGLQVVMANIFEYGLALALAVFVVSAGVEWRSVKAKNHVDQKNPSCDEESLVDQSQEVSKREKK